MRVGAVQLSEVTADGGRLTAGFHLSEDQVAVARIRRIANRCEPLRDLCLSRRGIFRGPIFRRVFVEDPARGEPYVSSSDLMQAHVEPAGYLSRKHHGALLDDLRLHEGMILLTRSGMNLGSAIWTRRDMDGLCATDDLIRIQPDPERVPPGYLYAFLAGRYGHAWIRKQIYGGSIKHVEPEQVAGMPVPRLDPSVELAADKLVTDASELMTTSEALLKQATRDFLAAVGLEDLGAQEWAHSGSDLSFSIPRPEAFSLRALNFAPRFRTLEARIKSGPWRSLGDICAGGTLRRGSRFTRVDGDPEHGVELVGQRQLFVLHPRGRHLARRFLVSDVFVEPGTTLVAAQGTLGESELYCRAEYVARASSSRGYSEHLLRVRPGAGEMPSGCLFAFLRSEIAFRMLRSISVGSKLQDHHSTLLPEIPIPFPGISVQTAVSESVGRAYDARIRAIEAHEAAAGMVVAAIEATA